MAQDETAAPGIQVTVTRFLNNAAEFLDIALREKVTLTQDGQPQWHITEASYLARLEAIAAVNLAGTPAPTVAKGNDDRTSEA